MVRVVSVYGSGLTARKVPPKTEMQRKDPTCERGSSYLQGFSICSIQNGSKRSGIRFNKCAEVTAIAPIAAIRPYGRSKALSTACESVSGAK